MYVILILLACFVTYEVSVVFIAYSKLEEKFLPYFSLFSGETGLSEERLNLVVKVQDPTFYHHSGIEWPSPLTTTTITQSLVKRLFFKKFTKGFYKVEQTLIARFVVHPFIDKRTQLVAFIETAYFGIHDGKQIFGMNHAAETLFGKNSAALSDDEYLSLLAMLPAPDTLTLHSEALTKRVHLIQKVFKGECAYVHVSQIFLKHCQ